MPGFLIRERVAVLVLSGLAAGLLGAAPVCGAALPVRPQVAGPLSPGAAAAAESLLVKLAHLRQSPAENAAIWTSVVEDAVLLAERSGLLTQGATGRVTATNYVITSATGWVAGPDADEVVGKWLAMLADQEADQRTEPLRGIFGSGDSARVGLQRLTRPAGASL